MYLAIFIDISIFAKTILLTMYDELYEQSGSDIIQQLGKRYSDYRKRMSYTQKEVSVKSGLSIFTISSFENGSSTGTTLASFIKMLRAIDSLDEIEKLLPELPESPRTLFKKQQKEYKRK
jgi:transcriptional regulator with XRE-family HTH domain